VKIRKVIATPGLNGFYNDDKAAIRKGAPMDGFIYRGEPLTPGFRMIRQPGECASIIFLLDDGSYAFGDALVVQYSGAGGREAMMTGAQMAELAVSALGPAFEGKEVTTFRQMSADVEDIEYQGRKIHPSVCYGASQAALDAVAKAKMLTAAEVVAEEYSLVIATEPVRIHAQSGDDRYSNVDKMILKKVGFMPHGLINNARDKVGASGEIFLEYAKWVRDRVLEIGEKGYKPVFRFDVYGTVGEIFENDPVRIADYLAEVRRVTEPFELFIEMPVDMGNAEDQYRVMRAIRNRLRDKNLKVGLIIDEYANTLSEIKQWADSDACDMVQAKPPDLGALHNTVEAVLYCKQAGKLVYLGGSCTETDQSARLCANVALATQPFALASKPGMGVDEALMVVGNEMQRVLAICRSR
jgi:methylaspartate ammonia-lyase